MEIAFVPIMIILPQMVFLIHDVDIAVNAMHFAILCLYTVMLTTANPRKIFVRSRKFLWWPLRWSLGRRRFLFDFCGGAIINFRLFGWRLDRCSYFCAGLACREPLTHKFLKHFRPLLLFFVRSRGEPFSLISRMHMIFCIDVRCNPVEVPPFVLLVTQLAVEPFVLEPYSFTPKFPTITLKTLQSIEKMHLVVCMSFAFSSF
mmetsp:Transcript_11987/g.19674  ORF Transcript_11987/g.19674 Transcript_11987/m.19674 type:complete len:203 (-) Transcript_11987:1574-2182(-)